MARVTRLSMVLVTVCGCQFSPGGIGPPPGSPTGGGWIGQDPPSVQSLDCPIASHGKPIAAPAGQWTWVDIPGARCRDGSGTGIGVRLEPGSKKVVVYLEGGGACFHDASCAINDVLASFDSAAFGAWQAASGAGGIFDDARADNPFHDWNAVYVPYCTGDVHAGDAEHVDVPGSAPKDQMFVGYRNIGLYLDRLVPTFASASEVVVTGISAGGFGAAFNYDRIAQSFCRAQVTLIDDSGPPMGDAYLAPCLQQRWRQLWNLDHTLPADCADCRGPDGGGIVHYVDYLAQKYPTARLGLVSANQDSVISLFFGFGANQCAGLSGPSAGMSGATFEQGLKELASRLDGHASWGDYIVPSVSHTWINPASFYVTQVSGMALPEWVNLLVNQGVATRIGN